MKYVAFNGDGEKIGDGVVVEYATKLQTMNRLMEVLTDSGLARSATTVQVVHHGKLVVMATRSATDDLRQFVWRVTIPCGAAKHHRPADGPITR